MHSIKNIEDLENLNELVSLENQVKTVALQDKLGKQNFQETMKKVFEPVTKSIKDVSEEVTKTLTETSNNNNKALENINSKLLEILKDRGILATHSMFPLSKITNPESTSQFKIVKDHNSNRVNYLLKHNTIPNILHEKLLTSRDSGTLFELKGDFLKMITTKTYNVDLASLSDRKLMYELAREMNFDLKEQSRIFTQNRTLIKLPKSPHVIVSASGTSNTKFLPSNRDELCHRLKLLLQEKHAGNNSNIINN